MRLRFSLLHVRVLRVSHQARFRAARRENHLVIRGIVDRRALGTVRGSGAAGELEHLPLSCVLTYAVRSIHYTQQISVDASYRS